MRERPNITTGLIIAILAVLVAWGVRLFFAPLLGERVPFITFFPIAFAVAWWGGIRPTILATMFSTFILVYFI